MLQRVKLSCFVCFACLVLAALSGCSSGGTLVKTDGGAPDAKSDAHDGAADSTAPPDTTGMDSGMDSTAPMDTTGSQDSSTPDTSSDVSQDTTPLDTSAPDTTPPTDTSPADTTPPADTSPTDSPPPAFTVGGSITGTGGGTVTLQDNGGDNLPVSMDGSFTFATPLASGAAFNVTVLSQMGVGLTCTVMGGTGTIAGANVTSVIVSCAGPPGDSGSMDTGTTDTGTADTGVADTGVADTGAADTGAADTGTVDSGTIDSGTVDSGGPTFTVGGTIMGLAPGDSVQLELNGGDATFFGSNGAFAFSMTLASGSAYAVTVEFSPATPTAQTCKVTNGSGTVGSGNVSSVGITCTTNSYTISGNVTLTGATGNDTITLRDNGVDMITIAAGATSPAPFTFATALLSGTPYTVTATPAGGTPITCTAEPVGTTSQGVAANAPAMGTVTNHNVTGILFECGP